MAVYKLLLHRAIKTLQLPASLKTKEDYIKYLKASFVYGHKAMNSVTERNLMENVK